MRFSKFTLLALLSIVLFSCKNKSDKNQQQSASVVAPQAKGAKRILFVGNSHTEYYVSLPTLFSEFCAYNNQDFKVESIIEMGISLNDIYTQQQSKVAEKMAQKDEDGNYYDYVVLQEKTPIAMENVEEYKSSVKKFVDDIHKNSPGTVVLIYEIIDPFDYKKDKASFDEYYPKMQENANTVVAQLKNAKVYQVGSAVKDAYDGKYNYVAYKEGKDLLRYEEDNTAHMINDAGFMAAVLLYETIFNTAPKIPATLSLSTGVGEGDEISKQEVSAVITNKDALMKIAFDHK